MKYLSLEKNVVESDIYRKAKFNLSICYFTVRNFKEGSELYAFRHETSVINQYSEKINGIKVLIKEKY